MHALKTMTVSVRSQSAIIIALAALWWFSFIFRDSLFGFQSDFWQAIGYLFPLILVVFAIILSVSYRRTGKPHRWMVRLALLAAASPWILFGLLFALAV